MSWMQDGRESSEEFVDLQDLHRRGLVSVSTRAVQFCDSPLRQAEGAYCGGWAIPGDPDGESVACETCGRLFDDEEVEELHVLRLNREAIIEELHQNLQARRLQDGVAWSVEGEHDDVLVVVADWSDGTRWMSNRTLRGRPFVLLQVDDVVTSSRLGRADWVLTLPLSAVLRDPPVLHRTIDRARELADQPRESDALTELHALTSRVVHSVRGAHLVEFGPVDIHVDDVSIRVPPGMHRVLAFLIDRHVEDMRDGKTPEAFCLWSLQDLSEALELPRTTVHKQLRRFQDRLHDQYSTTAHRPLPEQAVIQRFDGAWRFSPDCLVRLRET